MRCLLQGHVGTELYSVGFPVFPSFFFYENDLQHYSLFYNPSAYQLTRHALKDG